MTCRRLVLQEKCSETFIRSIGDRLFTYRIAVPTIQKGHPVKLLAEIRSHLVLVLLSVAKPAVIIVCISMVLALFAFLPLLAVSPDIGVDKPQVTSLLFAYGFPAHAAMKLLTFLPICAVGAAVGLISRHVQLQAVSDRGYAALFGALSCGMMSLAAGVFGSGVAAIVLFFAINGLFHSFPPEAIGLFAQAVGWLDGILENAGANTDMIGVGLVQLLLSGFFNDLLLLGVVALVLGGFAGVLIQLAVSDSNAAAISDTDVTTIGGTLAMVLASFTYAFYVEDVVIFTIASASCWWLFSSKTIAERVSIGAVCAIVGSMCWFSFFDFGYVTLLAFAFWGGRFAARTLSSGLDGDSTRSERLDATSTPELAVTT